MAEEPSHIKQLSLIHVCKIGLKVVSRERLWEQSLTLDVGGGPGAGCFLLF